MSELKEHTGSTFGAPSPAPSPVPPPPRWIDLTASLPEAAAVVMMVAMVGAARLHAGEPETARALMVVAKALEDGLGQLPPKEEPTE